MTRLFAILLFFTCLGFSAPASAQHVIRRGHARPVAADSAVVSAPASYPMAGSTATSAAQPARSYSYSYYTRSSLPARTYVGYGTDDFAYHGRPYGHPYDPWTWPMMSGAYGNGLAHYYDPPVK